MLNYDGLDLEENTVAKMTADVMMVAQSLRRGIAGASSHQCHWAGWYQKSRGLRKLNS